MFKQIVEKVKKINGFTDFNEMQEKAINENLANKNIIVSSPTSSGKTLVAEVYAINAVKNKKKRVIYLSPLKALASEHFKSFKKKYEKEFELKVAISTGDLDSSSKYLENYHIIFLTYEKLDSLLRHKANWLASVGLVIVDEIHVLDSNRGPTIESVLVQLKLLLPKMQIIGLSATIPNAVELAEWLNAEFIFSKYRPVKLKKGVYFDSVIYFEDNSQETIVSEGNSIEDLVKDTLKKEKQVLIFANTRKSTETIAKKLTFTKQFLKPKEAKSLRKQVEDFDLDNLTDFDKLLLNLAENGVAFHHAGVRQKLREFVENNFRERKIKVIVATTTLAAGINTPAYRVLIQSLFRHTEKGMRPIPVKEYLQMAGRAGRAGYDSEGEAIVFARSESDIEYLFDNYLFAEPEEIESQLGYVPVLRMILLGLIANEVIFDDDSLQNFFNNTFYAIRFKALEELNYKIYKILEELIEFGFVKLEDDSLKITELGRRVSELYIDPLSAYNLLNSIEKFEDMSLNQMLMSIVNTNELMPYFKPNKKLEQKLLEDLQSEYKQLGLTIDDLNEDWNLLDKYFTKLILEDWVNEVSEQEIIEKFGILPGILHNKLNIAEWMAYSLEELADLKGKLLIVRQAKKLQKRLKYGVKDDLLLLVELPNIGRTRARKLALHNIRTVLDIRKTDPEILANILGPKVAKKLLDHLNIPNNLNTKQKTQKDLFDF